MPGIDPEATPACVNSCIAGALHFGDIDDPESNVSKLLSEHKYYRMHEDVGTEPGFYYLWDHGSTNDVPLEPAPMVADPVGLSSVSSALQTSWDWRAAANFIFGGTGTGLFAFTALATLFAAPLWIAALLALALVATGLLCVWLEIGRPWRFINVYFNPKGSWMTREAIVALLFFATGLLALLSNITLIWLIAAGFGLIFLYCQGRILLAAKGIPAWRQTGIVPLIMASGLTEGLGLFAAIAAIAGLDTPLLQITIMALLVLLPIRYLVWFNYRTALGRKGAPTKAFKALDSGILNLSFTTHLVLLGIVVASYFIPALLIAGGLLAVASGWAFKFKLITKAAYNQGYSIERLPVRGAGKSVPGIKPGWTLS